MTPIRLYHDRQKHLVPDDEGDIIVQTGDGEQRRRAEVRELEGSYTEVVIPDGYEATPTSLSHLIDSLSSRHFDPADVYAVAVSPDGESDADSAAIAKRLAALLDAEFAADEDAIASAKKAAKKAAKK